ncbi:helix-turn-helix domain-containing protein [Sinorhizobium meliloti]|nr:helix-turn-helix domain-containing protein [Sinorhizobium meliloti]MDW9978081.1 helix-turn-helix domain-containing protein [Sinorhizobium meliloti]MDX0294719.1 helix-turn-helix domain-containing protein [Sinorhizobium meliloti]
MMKTMNQLGLLRAHSGLSQADFAEAMGVPFRTYQDLESGKSPLREIHLQAARMALIQLQQANPAKIVIPMPLDAFIRHTTEQHSRASSKPIKQPNPLHQLDLEVHTAIPSAAKTKRGETVFTFKNFELPAEIASQFEKKGVQTVFLAEIDFHRLNANGYVIPQKP